jgi:hypothetical protein
MLRKQPPSAPTWKIDLITSNAGGFINASADVTVIIVQSSDAFVELE